MLVVVVLVATVARVFPLHINNNGSAFSYVYPEILVLIDRSNLLISKLSAGDGKQRNWKGNTLLVYYKVVT